MNCEDFSDWLQGQLDQRCEVVLPEEMRSHVAHCDSCSGQVDAWNRIASVMPGDSPTITLDHPGTNWFVRGSSFALAIAACLIAVLGLGPYLNSSSFTKLAVLQPNPQTRSAASLPSDLVVASRIEAGEINNTPNSVTSQLSQSSPEEEDLAIDFWQELQTRDWLSESMPVVQSVRDGVAPLGRSILSAVTILTSGSEQPSVSRSI